MGKDRFETQQGCVNMYVYIHDVSTYIYRYIYVYIHTLSLYYIYTHYMHIIYILIHMYIHTKLHRRIHVVLVHAYVCSPESQLKVWGGDSFQRLNPH